MQASTAKSAVIAGLAFTLLSSCAPKYVYKFDPNVFPQPVDTRSRPIQYQEKRQYISSLGIVFDNQFDGARLNQWQEDDSTSFSIGIEPENTPINHSPWYSFRIISPIDTGIFVRLHYPEGFRHRYVPKLRYNRGRWVAIDSSQYHLNEDTTAAFLHLHLRAGDTLWVSAQELLTTNHIRAWLDSLKGHPWVQSVEEIGYSTLGRPLWFVNIGTPDDTHKDVIVVIARQHPPEVPGHMAMMAFVEALLDTTRRNANFFKHHQVWLYPLMNPDGVDLGHWRHNAGGIDLNRDWAYFRQPETRQVAQHVIHRAKKHKANIILGLDFHSTQYDVYYTFPDSVDRKLRYFDRYWIEGIAETLPPHPWVREAYDLNAPISKAWFLLQFHAESITFEIGDETPRDLVKMKGKAAAREMIKLLIMRCGKRK